MRINKFIAARTELSRRAADEAITQNRVTVNGILASSGQDVSETDIVVVDGMPLAEDSKKITIMLNKPVGYVCSRDGQGSPTVFELLPDAYKHLQPVGRLDKNSSGLLLLTNDGALHNELTHPKYQKEKRYTVTLNKPLTPEDKQYIENGIVLDDGLSSLALTLANNDEKIWHVSMHEGRNRQIRRTFTAAGYKVTALHRTHFGPYTLNNLHSGKIIVL